MQRERQDHAKKLNTEVAKVRQQAKQEIEDYKRQSEANRKLTAEEQDEASFVKDQRSSDLWQNSPEPYDGACELPIEESKL